MSNSVDEKVVALQFDNDNFEQNAQTSLSTIDRLKQALQFKEDSGKGLEGISKSVRDVDFSGMEQSVNTIAEKFKGLGIIGVTALQNITNKAVDTGTRLIKSLTIDPIASGMSEYELKLNSMRTIIASTSKEFKNRGEAIKKVNGYLNELNKYSDETIYSFSDMTNNIGKFTNAGVNLKDAVGAIKGISNEAARSGANAQEASRAMYNFSQALSAGYVKLIDWKSIENANMATKEFKEQLIQTAVATGDLTKKGDEYITKKGTAITATKHFNDSLQEGWMTTEVLTNTLNNYATDVTRMTKKEREAYEEKLKSIGYTKEQIKEVERIGTESYKAASEVTTWSKLVDTLQEAVQSGWAQTFEIIFGTLDKATNLWTNVNNVVSAFIDRTSSARNELLQAWADNKGRERLLQALANILKFIGSLLKPIGQAFRDVFKPADGKRLADATAKFEKLTERLKLSKRTADDIRQTFRGLFAVVGLVKDAFVAFIKAVAPAGLSVGAIAKVVISFSGALGRIVGTVATAIRQSGVIQAIGSKISKVVQGLVFILFKLSDGISRVVHFVGELTNTKIADRIKEIKDEVNEAATPAKQLGAGIEKLGGAAQKAKDKFAGLDAIGGILSDIGKDIKDSPIFAALGALKDKLLALLDNASFGKIAFNGLKLFAFLFIFKKVGGILGGINKTVEGVGTTVQSIGGVFKSVAGILNEAKETQQAIRRSMQAETFKTLAISIAILVGAINTLAKIPTADLAKAMVALGAIGALLLAAGLAVSTDKFDGKQMRRSAMMFAAIGISVNLIAKAAKTLGSMKTSELVKAGVAIAAFMLGITKITETSKGSFRAAAKFALMAGAIGLGMNLLVPSLVILGAMKPAAMVKAGVAMVAFIALFSRAGALAGKSKVNVLQFMGVAAAVSVFVPAITALSMLPFGKAMKAATALAFTVAAIGLASKAIGKDKIAAFSFMGVAVAVSILTPAIIALSNIPFGKAIKAATSLSLVMIALAGAVRIITGGGKGSFGDLALLAGMTMMIKAVSSSIIALAAVPFKDLLKSVVVLSSAMVILTTTASLVNASKKSVLTMAAVFAVMAVTTKIMGKVDAGTAAKNMTGIAAMLTAVSIACGILSKIPFPAAMTALGVFKVWVGGLLAGIALLGLLGKKIKGLESVLDEGVKIGGYIGKFIGAIVSGIMGGLTSGIVAVAQNLSKFMAELKPFLDDAKSIDPSVAEGVKNIAKAVLYITAADFINTLNSTPFNILSGGGMVDFAKDLGLLMDEIKSIADKANGITNVEQFNNVAKAIGTLGKAAMQIPTTGGLKGAILGVKDLGAFGEELGTFVPILAEVQNTASGMTKNGMESISNVASAITKLGEAAKAIPDSTADGHVSLKQIVMGMADLSDFGEELVAFIPSLTSITQTITGKGSGITPESMKLVGDVATAIGALGAAADKIPENLNGKSLKAKIEGTKDLPAFAKGIAKVAAALPALVEASAGLNEESATKIQLMAKIVSVMASAVEKVNTAGGGKKTTIGAGFDKFMTNMQKFAKKLAEFVPDFKTFAEKAGEINDEDLSAGLKVAKSVNSISGAYKVISGTKGKGGDVVDKFKSLAKGMTAYCEAVAGINTDGLQEKSEAIASSVKSVSKAMNKSGSFKSAGTKSINAYAKAIGNSDATSTAKSNAKSVAESVAKALKSSKVFTDAGSSAIKSFAKGLKSGSTASSAGKSMGKSAANGAKGADFYGAGTSGAAGFASGLNYGQGSVSSAGAALGEAAYKAAKAAIKSHSPSRKFMELGKYSDEGFAIGLMKYSDLVYKQGKKTGEQAVKGARTGYEGIIENIGNPRITPVIDLSDVRKGAKSISGILEATGTDINPRFIDGSINRQNGAFETMQMASKLEKIASKMTPQEPSKVYNIGDVTVDVSKLEDVTTLDDFVGMLRHAKAFN